MAAAPLNNGGCVLSLFSIIEGKQAVIKNAKTGVYRQVDLYERDGEIYAKASGGFIRLMKEQRTSHPVTKWEHLDVKYGLPVSICGGLRTVSNVTALSRAS